MGKIIRNGVEYSGATEDATAVNYDNSLSGLEAQTVQEAVDELSESLEGMGTYNSQEHKIGNMTDNIGVYRYMWSSALSQGATTYKTTLPFQYKNIVKVDGIVVRNSGMIVPINQYVENHEAHICSFINGDTFWAKFGTDFNDLKSITIIIEYTKDI